VPRSVEHERDSRDQEKKRPRHCSAGLEPANRLVQLVRDEALVVVVGPVEERESRDEQPDPDDRADDVQEQEHLVPAHVSVSWLGGKVAIDGRAISLILSRGRPRGTSGLRGPERGNLLSTLNGWPRPCASGPSSAALGSHQ
jgi:hypothetical protein